MNANSPPQTQVIKDHRHSGVPLLRDWLLEATRRLSSIGIPSAKLDSELILAHALGKSRTYLHVHDDEILNTQIIKAANDCLEQRLRRVPIAYIVGYKEFYGRQFLVTPATLIPRPESEDIITELIRILPPTTYHLPPTKLIDVGTGSGCLGITAKLEFPKLDVTLLDISNDALKVARQNAKIHLTKVNILHSDLVQNYSKHPDIIIANLPYVDKSWDRSPEIEYEPSLALFAENHGLSIIEKLIFQARNSITPGGYLIIEADPSQHNLIIEFSKKQFFIKTHQISYVVAFKFKPKNN